VRYGFGYFEEDKLGQVADIGLWRRIIAYSRPHWGKVSGAVILSMIVIGSSLALPYMIRLGIDHYVVNTALESSARINGLGWLASLFVAVVIAGFAANFYQVFILEWTGQTIMHQMRQQLFDHMLGLDLAFFNENPSGKLVTRLTNDIQNMHEMFTSVIVTLFNDFFQLAGIMAILFWMNWRLALILSFLLPVIIVGVSWFSRLARETFRDIRTRLARINAFLQESLSGIAVIQLFLREKDTHAKFVELSREYLDKNLFQIRIFGIFMPSMELFNALAVGCIIWYGGGEVIRKNLSLGELVAFISYIRLFFQPVRELSQKYSIVQSAMASAERIFQLLDMRSSLFSPEKNEKQADFRGEVVFQNVQFSYKEGQPVLHNLSFRIPPGGTLAIVGATGSGKSTIVNLLERFYDPASGAIRIDGRDIRSCNINQLRRQIGLVMQDIFIVPGSIRDNILLDLVMDDTRLHNIIEQAQLSGMIGRLPDGLKTMIGEGNMDLSAGQKQLLAFARVLARNPRILILDEATSSVDSETEMLIDRAIETTLANRTSIVIAHRLSTIKRADHILVMEQGAIAEEGSHDELMARGGIYRRLQDLQVNGQERNEGE